MALAIIEKHNINAIMLSSMDLAILIAEKLALAGITRSITFIVGNYFYNYEPDTGMLRNALLLYRLERKYKHEFGVFDPYTGLDAQSRGDVSV